MYWSLPIKMFVAQALHSPFFSAVAPVIWVPALHRTKGLHVVCEWALSSWYPSQSLVSQYSQNEPSIHSPGSQVERRLR